MTSEWIHAAIAVGGVVFTGGVTYGVLKTLVSSLAKSHDRLEGKVDKLGEKVDELTGALSETKEDVAEMRGRLLGPFNGHSRAAAR